MLPPLVLMRDVSVVHALFIVLLLYFNRDFLFHLVVFPLRAFLVR